MEDKNNRIVLGIIFMLLAIFSILQRNMEINYGSIAMIFTGFAFLILYKTKRKSWSLILSVYLIYFGLVGLLMALGLTGIDTILIAPAFFVVPGIIFIILYLEKNKTGLLYPGSILFWIGICILLDKLDLSIFQKGGLFPLCSGLSFLTIYKLDRNKRSKWLLYTALVLSLIGIIRLIKGELPFWEFIPNAISVVLIIASLCLIFGKKNKRL